MPSVRNNGWITITGNEISDLKKQYGTFVGIPETEQHIYYGNAEIKIDNPHSTTHSTVYSLKKIKLNFGYNEIHDIDQNWGRFIGEIQSYMNSHEINIDDPDTAYYYVNKPFVINESCVIFYDDSSKTSIAGSKYQNYAVILVDEFAVPNVIRITADYSGAIIPVGEQFEEDKLLVSAIYDDGSSVKITSNYVIEPPDKVVTKLGSNVFTVYYSDPENDVNTASFIVQGCRNLQSIRGYYDGDAVPYNKEAEKKYFVIIAHYTDGTESTVTDYTFTNGNIVSKENEGVIDIFYQGRTCQVEVPIFEVTSSRLIAVYNGPNVEVGHDYQIGYLNIKIFYASDTEINKSYYETINIEDCVVSDRTVTEIGANSFTVSYNGQFGTITTTFTVVGFIPDVKPTDIQATYTGPGVYQGGTFDLERVICNIYYNDGTIRTVKNFTVDTNIIQNIGSNEITVTYTEDATTLTDLIYINGLENDSTTGVNVFPANLKNKYPRATVLNNRYRGPAEGMKTDDFARMIIENLRELYKIYEQLNKEYNELIVQVAGESCTKNITLNNVSYVDNQLDDILNSDKYTTGIYKSEDKVK